MLMLRFLTQNSVTPSSLKTSPDLVHQDQLILLAQLPGLLMFNLQFSIEKPEKRFTLTINKPSLIKLLDPMALTDQLSTQLKGLARLMVVLHKQELTMLVPHTATSEEVLVDNKDSTPKRDLQ